MAIDEKILQEELAMLKADFDKTKKQIESVEKEIVNMRNNLNAIYGAVQQTEKLLKLSKEKENEKV
jgi:septal ring factor EnvC (AmiA/AmiB activator)